MCTCVSLCSNSIQMTAIVKGVSLIEEEHASLIERASTAELCYKNTTMELLRRLSSHAPAIFKLSLASS